MRTTTRRKLDVFLIAVGGAGVAGIAAISAFAYNEERIDGLWTSASIRPDGTADLHEVIDYNFGNAFDRHGLLRTIPGLTTSSPLAVSSPDGAPDGIHSIADHVFDGGTNGIEVRVGDANINVTGRHRYVLDYALDTLGTDTGIAWNAVGEGWDVPIEEAEAHLIAPFELEDVVCQQGGLGSLDPCEDSVEVDEVEPGHLVVRVDDRIEQENITVRATRGADLAAAATLPTAPQPPELPGEGMALPAAVALVATVGGGLSMSRWVRRAGRERVGVGLGGATDAAFVDTMGTTSERLVDSTELGGLATTEFAPPDGITAPMGGVLLAEAVRPEHKVAWLLETAIDGAVDMDDTHGKLRLTRAAPGDPASKDILDAAFGGRQELELGSYDKTFANGWTALGTHLDAQAEASGFWDPYGDRRKTRVRVLGALACIVGGLLVVGGGALTGRFGGGWMALLVAGALVAGAGWSAALRGWELRVRTPQGSAAWLRVESFRRFLRDSEAFHAEEAAKRGVLREYTAWAVAVGEIDRWKHAVESSTVIPDTAGLHYVAMAPLIHSSTVSASTAPSSSGSGGGGGGGGAGGGGGGGGGGSW